MRTRSSLLAVVVLICWIQTGSSQNQIDPPDPPPSPAIPAPYAPCTAPSVCIITRPIVNFSATPTVVLPGGQVTLDYSVDSNYQSLPGTGTVPQPLQNVVIHDSITDKYYLLAAQSISGSGLPNNGVASGQLTFTPNINTMYTLMVDSGDCLAKAQVYVKLHSSKAEVVPASTSQASKGRSKAPKAARQR